MHILENQYLRWSLSTSRGLQATSLKNKISGRTIEFKRGFELKVQIDGGADRITISGWRGAKEGDGTPSAEVCAQPGFDDDNWEGFPSGLGQAMGTHATPGTVFRRTHAFIPKVWRRRQVRFVVGGWRLFDYRSIRVFLNGREVGHREVDEGWHQPGEILLPSDHIRYNQDNVLFLRLSDQITRTAELDHFDPRGVVELSWQAAWPAQFEQYLYSGTNKRTINFTVDSVASSSGMIAVALSATQAPIKARVHYRLQARKPILTRAVTLSNAGDASVRILNVQLGHYGVEETVSTGEQGFPVHVADDVFFALAHPSGWCKGQDGVVDLEQYPAIRLEAGEAFRCMDAIFGVSETGETKAAFRSLIESRMRRIRAGHNRAYAIYDNFGCWEKKNPNAFLEDRSREEILLESFSWLAEAEEQTGLHFDYNDIHFWFDTGGDVERPDPRYFPEGFDCIFAELKRLRIKPGLWIDSTLGHWSIGRNPLVAPCGNYGQEYQRSSSEPVVFCRATDPIRTMFAEAYQSHLDRGVQLCKFDNFVAWCTNPSHGHYPGVYSTEAIQNSMIEFLTKLAAHAPDIFIMLYWGFRSPWWLLYGDTIFEPGLRIEAASPGTAPTLYARSGVIDGLDAAQRWADEVPALGKDSLGVWLSDWGWNSSIGRDGWQDAFVMDMARGNLLPQIWSDWGLLDEPRRLELACFVRLSRENERCFGRTRPIIGKAGSGQPYGYVCPGVDRAFVAIHNAGWTDFERCVGFATDLGLPIDRAWRAYRVHPSPAQLVPAHAEEHFADSLPIALRPWGVCLVELVAKGEESSHRGVLPREQASSRFRSSAIEIGITLDEPERSVEPESGRALVRVHGRAELHESFTGKLFFSAEAADESGRACTTMHPHDQFSIHVRTDGEVLHAAAVLGEYTYPVSWQAWRRDHIRLRAESEIEFELTVKHTSVSRVVPRLRLIPSDGLADAGQAFG